METGFLCGPCRSPAALVLMLWVGGGGVYRLRHGTRGVPLCAACQTWLTCGHLCPDPPGCTMVWVSRGRRGRVKQGLPPPIVAPGCSSWRRRFFDEVVQDVAGRQIGPRDCVGAERPGAPHRHQNNELDCWFPSPPHPPGPPPHPLLLCVLQP